MSDQELRPFEHWAKELKTARVFLKAMVRKFDWPKLREMTREAFLEALAETRNHRPKR